MSRGRDGLPGGRGKRYDSDDMKHEYGDSHEMSVPVLPSESAPDDTLVRRFDLAVARDPGAVAVRDARGALSYGELADASRQLAERLTRVAGDRGGPVAVLLDAGPAQAAAALAALRTGRPYMPVDPSYPRRRIETVLADAVPAAVVEDPGTPAAPPRVGPGPRTAGDPPHVTADDAYVIHTSGSTGTPKGTVIGHRGVLTMLDAFEALRPLQPGDRCATCASPGFDAAVLETWAALITGGELLATPDRSRWDATAFAHWLARESVGHAYVPAPFLPALAEGLRDGLDLSALRRVVVAVEPIPRGLLGDIKRALPGLTLINGYGPTEAAVCVTMYQVTADDDGPHRAPIGTAIPGVTLRVEPPLTGAAAPPAAPPAPAGPAGRDGGSEGELHIGGPVVGRPLRGERAAFYRGPAPGGGSTAWFRTGDLVRRDAQGRFTFLGRADDMMKIRGYRVEPGEVEHALLEDPDIDQAVALPHPAGPAGAAELVAHAVPRTGTRPSSAGVRRRLTDRLPWYAVPHRVEFHTAFPLTVHGKIDRAALTAAPDPGARTPAAPPGGPRAPARPAPAAPGTDPLAALWNDVLHGAGPRTAFLAAGGDSLAAGRIAAAVHSTLGKDLRMVDVLLAEGLDALRKTVADAPDAPPGPAPARPAGPVPATEGQRALWLHQVRRPGSPLHNEPLVLRLRGPLGTAALAAALDGLTTRHEALRTVLTDDDGTPVLTVRPPAPVPLPVRDLPDAGDDTVERAVRAAAREPFDLATGPLLRALLLRAAPEDHVFVLTVHHAVFDGTSADVIFEELAERCAAHTAGRVPRLGAPPAPFTEHAAHEHAAATSGALEAGVAHWRERLAGLPTATRLPTTAPRPADPGDAGDLTLVRLPRDLTGRLDTLAGESGVTRFTVLLAALHVLLARYCGTRDVSVGTPFSLRGLPGTERSVGYYLNTLPLRAGLSGDPDFRTLLTRTRTTLADAHAHRAVPYPLLLERLGTATDSPTPYLDVCLVPEDVYRHRFELAGAQAEFAYYGTGTAKFDLTLGIVPDDGDGLRLTAEYRTALFEPAAVERLLEHYRTLLESVTDRPGEPVTALSMLPEAEHALLTGPFATARPAPGEENHRETLHRATVHDLVQRAADRTPDAPALTDGTTFMTYRQLMAETGRIASYLAEQGAEPGTRIGVRMPRGAAVVTAFLAVLRTGAAYVPLDPAQPPARLAEVVRDAGLLLEITPGLLDADAAFIASLPDRAPAVAVRPQDPAYVIHTSGSTGTPKGVEVPHRAVTDLALGAPAWTGLTAASRLLTTASPAFDMVTFDIWCTLAAGALLAVAPPGPLTPEALADALVRHAVTHAGLPTALLHRQAEEDPASFAGLEAVVTGGEVLAPALAARVLAAAPGLRLVNGYGPTEATAYATHHTLTAPADPASPVPLGRPTPRTVVRILDVHRRPAPPGVPGELHLGGPGLALGYAGRPGQTAERFAPDPFGPPGALLYATGDLARWRPDGTIEYAGRADGQIKLHGHRVEPGEIEAVLREHPAVTQAVVVRREDHPGRPYLAAYHTTADGTPVPSAELTALTAGRLPPPLVPRVHVHLDHLPVTPGGKTDRAALPAPAPPSGPAAGPTGAGTPGDPAGVVTAVWREVLVLDAVDPDERLFDIGGASLHATRIHQRVAELLDPPGLRVIDLFEHPTPRAYTAHVRRLLGPDRAGPA